MRFDAKILYGLDSGVPLPGDGAGGSEEGGGGTQRNQVLALLFSSYVMMCYQ